jgi:ABC-type uncharacterized transport system ATPase subunit
MNILYGIYTRDAGEIEWKGQPVSFTSPKDAIDCRIGMVHQHFMLVPSFTAAENVVLGSEPRKNSVIMDFDEAVKITEALSEKYGLYVDPYQRVEDLSVGIQQRIEILKILYKGADILILDEPTEGMDPIIKQQCLKLIKMEAQSGRTILLTTQRLDEAEEICNSIIIIKNGSTLIQGPINEIKKVIGESFQVKLCFDQVTAEIEAEIRKMKMIEEVNINYKESYLEFIINKKVYNPLEIINQFTQNHCVTKFEVKEPSLETVFMKIIQRKEENK